MEKNKKGSFAGLIYRDLYLTRKDILTGLILFAGFAVFGWLVLLSFNYGNLGKIMTNVLMSGDGTLSPEAEEAFTNARKAIFFGMKFWPAILSMEFSILTTNIAAKDTMTSWHRYLHCTPVTPFRYAAVKTAVNVIMTAIAFGLSVSYMFIIGLISGEYLSYSEISLLMLMVIVICMFGVIGQIFILLFGNRDKGMLASMAVIMLAVWAFASSVGNSDAEANGFDSLIAGAEAVMPYSPLILAGLFAVLFTAVYFIYRRREK